MNFTELFNKKSLIAGHRGASLSAPENTLLSMKKSVGHCDFLEMDVQLSSDGVAVIMHDNTLGRTTNVSELEIFESRYPYNVSDFTYDELNLLNYGNAEKLLTLRIALGFIREHSLYLNIEIKDVKENFSDEKIVSTVLKEIKEFGVENQVLISSFSSKYLSLVKTISPNIATAYLVDTYRDDLVEFLNRLGVIACNISKEFVNKDLVNRLNAANIFVNAYVVNDKKEQEKFFAMGVSAVFVDLCTT